MDHDKAKALNEHLAAELKDAWYVLTVLPKNSYEFDVCTNTPNAEATMKLLMMTTVDLLDGAKTVITNKP